MGLTKKKNSTKGFSNLEELNFRDSVQKKSLI